MNTFTINYPQAVALQKLTRDCCLITITGITEENGIKLVTAQTIMPYEYLIDRRGNTTLLSDAIPFFELDDFKAGYKSMETNLRTHGTLIDFEAAKEIIRNKVGSGEYSWEYAAGRLAAIKDYQDTHK
jgi:hypothetical protein